MIYVICLRTCRRCSADICQSLQTTPVAVIIAFIDHFAIRKGHYDEARKRFARTIQNLFKPLLQCVDLLLGQFSINRFHLVVPS